MDSKDILLVSGPILGFLAPAIIAIVHHLLNKMKIHQEHRSNLMAEFNKLVLECDNVNESSYSENNLGLISKLILIYQLGSENKFLILPAYQVLQLSRDKLFWKNYDVKFIEELINELELKIHKKYLGKKIMKIDGVVRIKSQVTRCVKIFLPPKIIN